MLPSEKKPLSNFANLLLFDKLTLGYLFILPVLFLVWGNDLSTWPFVVFGYPITFILIWLLIRQQNSLPSWIGWLRQWYPMVLFTFFFSIMGRSVNIFFPFWLEPYLVESDRLIFGQDPWLLFSTQISPIIIEICAFAYWSYYAIIPLVVWIHYRRRGFGDNLLSLPYERVMARVCLVMFSCYAGFLLMPARGPHHVFNLSHAELFSGGFFFDLVLLIQRHGAVVGAAFPSSHVAAVWTVLLTLWTGFRKLFWLFLPLVIGITVSTFLIQYHYFLDAVAGVLLAFVIEFIMSRQESDAKISQQSPVSPKLEKAIFLNKDLVRKTG